jgi:hypothetical protein
MASPDDALAPEAGGLQAFAAIELHDHLLVVSNDLDRLQSLLADACTTLLQSFHGAHATLNGIAAPAADPILNAGVAAAAQQIGDAIIALQFQDMASQLIEHSHRRLRSCADQLARQTMPDDDDGTALVEEAPLHPNPVTQDEMDAGSVELF